MLQHHDSRNPRDQESAECSLPSIPQKAEDGRDADTMLYHRDEDFDFDEWQRSLEPAKRGAY
jgi:hypothetical protein